MHDIDELRTYALLHARAQGLPAATTERTLAAVVDDGDGPASWTQVWSAEGRRALTARRPLQAAACFNLARFPVVDSPARREALRACIEAVDVWRRGHPAVRRRTLPTDDGAFDYYLRPARRPGRALVVLLGGIVSLKEQWAPLIPAVARLGYAVAVTELPGVGSNRTLYTADAHRQLSRVIDDAGTVQPVSGCLVVGMRFGGHLALRAALRDERIRGVATVGAPLTGFFEPDHRPPVPRITRDVLAVLTGTDADRLPGALAGWGLRPDELARLRIPVRYVASARDEIVPQQDAADLARWAPDVRIRRFDDVHGSPDHVAATRRFLIGFLLGRRRPTLPLRPARAPDRGVAR